MIIGLANAVNSRGCVMKERRSFTDSVTFSQALEGVPKTDICIGRFLHWEIALEEATINTELLDAMFEVWL
jgi:hypothetical protein